MNYEGILEFKGTWRKYQARVLEHADRYMADGKKKILAHPGSEKNKLCRPGPGKRHWELN